VHIWRLLQLPVLVALAVFPATAWAAEPTTTVWQPDRAKPVEVAADQMSVDDTAKIAIFWGDVVLTQDDVRLQCSKALFRYHATQGDQLGAIDRVECEQ
jgi:lipopolysaccharide export system protein LptA